MADYDSSLPIRSEADGSDERVQVKIVDSSSPDTQQATVDSDSNVKVAVYGDDPAGSDKAIRLSQLGAPNPDGDYDATNNTKPASSSPIVHDRAGTGSSPDETAQNLRQTGVEYDDGSSTVVVADVGIRDEDGVPFSQSNPLPVALSESEGDEIEDYQTSASVAKDASTDHDYTVSASKTLIGKGLIASGSGKIKVEVKLETAAASGTFNTKYVGFNSTANPMVQFDFKSIMKQVTGAKVRITMTNLDNQPQDLYSTLQAIEV